MTAAESTEPASDRGQYVEVIDEREVAMWAEMERPSGRFREDMDLSAKEVLEQIVESSAVYRRLKGPSVVEVSSGPAPIRALAGETWVDLTGQTHVALYDNSPWTALHEIAHVLTYGESHSRRWLNVYRELVRERYGGTVSDSFDFDKARAWLESEVW